MDYSGLLKRGIGVLAGLFTFLCPATDKLFFSCDFSNGFEPQICTRPCSIVNNDAQIINVDAGKAVLFGKDSTGAMSQVTYRFEGAASHSDAPTFPIRAGRMEFRFRPVDWKTGDPSFNMLIAMSGSSNMVFHLIYVRASTTGLPSIQAAYGRNDNSKLEKGKMPVLFPTVPLKKDQEWHKVVFEWSLHQLKLTVDGNDQILSTRAMTIPEQDFRVEELKIGVANPTLLRGMTEITDLKIFAVTLDAPVETVKHRPELQIPHISAPKTDGVIEAGEYAGALRVTGFIQLPAGRVASRQSVAYLGQDGKNLYIALESPLHQKEPKRTYVDTDANLWEDDSVELFLDPTPDTPDYYQWIFNYNGAVFDQHVVPGKSVSECRTFTASGVQVESKFDTGTRTMEIVLPLNTIGGAPAPGKEWSFNLCETNPGDGVYSLACVKNSYAEHDAFGRLSFLPVGKANFRLERLGELYRGKPEIIARASTVEVTGRRYDETAMTEFPVFSEVVLAGPDGLARFSANPDLLGKNGTLYLTAFENNHVIYAGKFPYEVISNVDIENMRRIPDSKGDRLKVTTSQAAGKENQLRFSLLDTPGKAVKIFPLVPVRSFRQETLLPLKGILPGMYRLAMDLTDESGKTVQAAEPRDLTIFDSIRPWQNTQIGVTDQVPPPWTPLDVNIPNDAIIVKCWNREYCFKADSLFPTSLKSGGTNYLNEVPKLLISDCGKQYTVPSSSMKLISHSKRRVVIATNGDVPEIARFNVTTTIDYDGFIWFDCDIEPAKPLSVDKLQIQFTMPKAQATLLNSGYRDLTDTGIIPQRQWSKKLDDLFGPFWVGNEKGGLSFGIESVENWSNRDSGRQAVLDPNAETILVSLNFIDMPASLTKPVHYGFYVHPTPVRPRPIPFRTLRSNMYFSHVRETMNGNPYPENLSWWTATYKYQGYPYWLTSKEGVADWEKSIKVTPQPWNNFDGLPSKKYRTAWYAAYSSIGRNAPETIWYGEEWRAGERDKLYGDTLYSYEEDMIEVCKTDDYINFYLWRLDRSRLEDLKIDGIYFDLMQFPACTRADHHHGYVGTDGKRRPIWSIREHRKFLERIYSYCKLKADNAPVIMHMSGATARIAGFSFADYYLDGELWSDILVRDRSYRSLRLDQFRAEALPHIYGPGLTWVCQLHRILPFVPANQRKSWKLEPWAERHMAGILLLHDIIPDRTSQFDTAYKIWLALDRFGLAEQDEYLPYYEQPNRFAVNADGINTAVTAFRKNGKLLMVLFNNHDDEFTFELCPQLGKVLGMEKENPVITDLETGKNITSDMFPSSRIPVSKRNFRLFELNFQ